MSREPRNRPQSLSHVDARGAARMVDVSKKAVTIRRAVASAVVTFSPRTLARIQRGGLPKGDVLAVARLAGIQSAKRTHELIPLCHPLPIEAVHVDFDVLPPRTIRIRAETIVRARTGVEMEALTAAAVAALTLYDMCKAVDRAIEIGPVRLESKSGGRAGTWRRRRPRS